MKEQNLRRVKFCPFCSSSNIKRDGGSENFLCRSCFFLFVFRDIVEVGGQ